MELLEEEEMGLLGMPGIGMTILRSFFTFGGGSTATGADLSIGAGGFDGFMKKPTFVDVTLKLFLTAVCLGGGSSTLLMIRKSLGLMNFVLLLRLAFQGESASFFVIPWLRNTLFLFSACCCLLAALTSSLLF